VAGVRVPEPARRIAFLITSSGVGGAEHQVRDLALGMRVRGWDASAFEHLPRAGIETISLAMRQGSPDPRAFARLAAWLRRWRPTVLHAHMVHANLLARLVRPISRTPVVICTIHTQRQGARWRAVAYRATDRLSHLTTAVSDVARRDAVSAGAVPAGRIVVVPNGIDPGRWRHDIAARTRVRDEMGLGDTFLWLVAGRLTDAKDLPNLVAAVGELDVAQDQVRVAIAGTGPNEAALRSLVDSSGLASTILFLGGRDDVPALMSAADAYVMSSAWEGLPLVLLEAGASGLPIVATDVGGNREAVIDGEGGYVVPARDHVALAAAMERVMGLSEPERTSMGAAARRHIGSTFDITVVLDRWEQIYADVLARR
jgi:glycosyltransferase involved in cell wall biosynthesis